MGSCFGSETVDTSSSTSLPSWLDESAKRSVNLLENISERPYQPYGGKRVADLNNTDFNDARDMIQENTGIWRPRTKQAGGVMGQVAGYTPNDITAGQVKDADFDAYMNPYIQSVLQDSLSEMDRQAGIQRNQIGANMAQGEAFGGSRHGVVEAEQRRNEADLRNQTINRTYADAFANALGMAEGDINRTFSADQFNVNSGLAGQQLNLSAANDLAGLGSLEQKLAYQDAEARMDLADRRRLYEQQRADVEYADFLREYNYPSDILNQRIAALSGVPYGSTTYGEQPTGNSFAQTLGGVGTLIGGLGAAGVFG